MPKKEPLPNLRIKRQSLPDTLAESLRERILNGEFKEGESLIQETIATEYGVSRMPVREAFKELEASGLITTQIHKGSVVKSIPWSKSRSCLICEPCWSQSCWNAHCRE